MSTPLLTFYKHTIKQDESIERTLEQKKRLNILNSLTNSSKDIITTMLINGIDIRESHKLLEKDNDELKYDGFYDKSLDKRLLMKQDKKNKLIKKYRSKKKNLEDCSEKITGFLIDEDFNFELEENTGVLFCLYKITVSHGIYYETSGVVVSLNYRKLKNIADIIKKKYPMMVIIYQI